MQMIAGLHYNFSLPDSAWPLAGLGGASEGYFALIRIFRRHAWLLLYLFGASPAVCASFVEGRKHALEELAPGTLYLPHATSLRMGRLGYLSEAQDSVAVSYNSIESYTACLHDVLTKPYAPYEAIGIRDGEGNYRQLATSLLQIENEFYSTIRPKRVIRPGARPRARIAPGPRRQDGRAARVGRRGARPMQNDRRGPGFGARRHRVPRRALSRREGGGASRVAALGARPRRDARALRKFLLALR